MDPDYIIPIAPITKKNSQQILRTRQGRPFIAPSARYRQYAMQAGWALKPRPEKPIDYPVNIRYLFCVPDRRRRDLSNLVEAIDDILQDAGIIADDCYQIVRGHDGTRCVVDKENPRTEIYIERMDYDE